MTGSESHDAGPKMSALCRTVKKDGSDLEIFIYEGDEGKWILEIESDTGASTVWDDLFESEQAALDEALKTIGENGIEHFR
jgi:hypothetical protein